MCFIGADCQMAGFICRICLYFIINLKQAYRRRFMHHYTQKMSKKKKIEIVNLPFAKI